MNRKEQCLKGLGISGGVAYAKSCLMANIFKEVKHYKQIIDADVPLEIIRFQNAIKEITIKLDRLIPSITKKVGKSEANIFSALKLMIEDKELHKKIIKTIEDNVSCAELAVISVFEKYEKILSSSNDDYIKERAIDLKDLKQHLLKELGNTNNLFKCEGLSKCHKGHRRIVVASELTPSLTATFDLYETRGFVAEAGGENSHAAILARGMGVPAVSNVPDATNVIFCDTDVLVDGDQGLVYINPSEETLASYTNINRSNEGAVTDPVEGLQVLANISRVQDTELATKYRAEGVGLYRTEIEFISQNRHLTEDQQFENYKEIMAAMPNQSYYFRMLDIGGDKPLDFIEIPAEENPALGLRGSRFLIHYQDFFKNQARALARASQLGPIGVMYPMVGSLAQFLKLKELFNETVKDLKCGEIKHGVLFEIPAACIMAEEILEHADFGSIGTNDLIQYLMAVDRGNALVAAEHDSGSPALWLVLKIIADASNKFSKPLSVCGELAGNTEYLEKFIDLGIKTVSVDPHSISKVRAKATELFKK